MVSHNSRPMGRKLNLTNQTKHFFLKQAVNIGLNILFSLNRSGVFAHFVFMSFTNKLSVCVAAVYKNIHSCHIGAQDLNEVLPLDEMWCFEFCSFRRCNVTLCAM